MTTQSDGISDIHLLPQVSPAISQTSIRSISKLFHGWF
jgi:hypothetical protein